MSDDYRTPKPSDKPTFLPQHVEYLEARKIPLEFAERAGIESLDVPSNPVAASLKRRFPGLPIYPSSGLLIPYTATPADGIRRCRVRWDNDCYYKGTPGADEQRVDIPRYSAQADVAVVPYFPPGVYAMTEDPRVPLHIVEAPMKALSLTANGFPAIGMGGVEAGYQDVQQWRAAKHLAINKELDRVIWMGRVAYIVYDAGILQNPRVALGAAKLAVVLRDRGADVRIVILPMVHVQERTLDDLILYGTDDQGPDDFLARHGKEALQQLVDAAVHADAVSRVRAITGSGADKATKRDRVAALLHDLTFLAAVDIGGQLEAERVAEETKPMGIKLRALKEQVDRFLRRLDRQDSNSDVGDLPYKIDNGRLAMTTLARGVPTTRYLADFEACIEEEIVTDDGAQQTIMYKLEAKLPDGQTLPSINVRAVEFAQMEWTAHLGAKAFLRAGHDVRDHARVAIQALSKPTTATVYTHLGWREVGGKRVYLHPGGAIGGDTPVRVSVGVERGSFGLPDQVEHLTEAVKLSLSILRVGPMEMTLPALAATYTSVLAELLEIDFGVWLVGPSGSFKSTLAAKAQSHFGRFDYHSLPGNWNSTAGAIEALLFKVKDALVVIDNYVPGQTQRDQQALSGLALRVIQAIGDRSGRGRLDRNAEERATRRPRGLALMTGEDLPPTNESTLGRLVVVDVRKGALSLDMLAAVQDRAHLLPHAMRGFIEWLAARIEADADKIRKLRRGIAASYRAQLASANVHERTANSLATLAVGFGLFVDFAHHLGVVDDDACDHLNRAADAALVTLARKQRANVEGQKPTERYMASLRALLLQGRVALADPKQQLNYTTLPECRGVGWLDDAHVYLDPTLAWAAVEEFNAREGWPYRKTQLHKQLADVGIIQREDGADDAESRLTCRRPLGGATRRVFVIARSHLVEAIPDPEETKRAAERDEQARRDRLAENGISIDDPDFEQLLN